jgi:hypothetical protein
MANTNDFQRCKEYLMGYIQNIEKQLNQCRMELTNHFQSCSIPNAILSFDKIQQCLKQMVDHERKYLSMRNNDELFKFKEDIHEKNLFKTISTSSLINNQYVSLYTF